MCGVQGHLEARKYWAQEKCGIIKNPRGEFATCVAHSTPAEVEMFYKECLYDSCG